MDAADVVEHVDVAVGDEHLLWDATIRANSSPSLSLFATGSSAASPSCGRFTPWRASLTASSLDLVMAMRSLSTSSTGALSFWAGWDDGWDGGWDCGWDDRKEDREYAVACRASGGSGVREGERRLEGERDGTPVLRPLAEVVRESRLYTGNTGLPTDC